MTAQLAFQTASTPPAAWMSPSSPEPLRAAGTVLHIVAGRGIFAEGDNSDMLYRVISGVVRVCRFLSDGRRQIEAFHVEGDVFGFTTGSEHVLSAEAVSDCTLVAYRRRSVETMAMTDGTVGRQMFQFAMQNLDQARTHALLLGRRGAVEKVAAFLLAWSEHFSNRRIVHLPMTRQDMADYLGLTIESVSRSLSQMERDGLIALPNNREVRLSRMDALEELAA